MKSPLSSPRSTHADLPMCFSMCVSTTSKAYAFATSKGGNLPLGVLSAESVADEVMVPRTLRRGWRAYAVSSTTYTDKTVQAHNKSPNID